MAWICLQPSRDNQMHSRAGCLIHGDSIKDPGTASNGCIVIRLNVRKAICASDDRQVEVNR